MSVGHSSLNSFTFESFIQTSYMSRTFLKSTFAATVAIASFGLATPGQANESDRFSDPNVVGNVPQEATLAKVGDVQAVDMTLLSPAIATIYAHDLDGRAAATVYVRSIPVFTFLAPEGWDAPASAEGTIAASADLDVNDPAVRATALASTINQYHGEGGDASSISVRWDEDSDTYLVEAGATLLVTMDDNVILPKTTGASAEDALLATNLLRRQLGESEALAKVEGLPDRPTFGAVQSTFSGMASWYGPGFHGRTSASGERFNQYAMTAAHRTLPFGTMVEVTNLNNGSTTVVRINDRGPFSHGRVIDLSAAAAQAIGMMGSGVAPVSVNVLDGRTASR